MKSKTIKTKQDFCWHFVDVYLEMLSHIGAIYDDEVFCKKFYDLKNYLDKKLALENDGEIIETYVVVLQQRND